MINMAYIKFHGITGTKQMADSNRLEKNVNITKRETFYIIETV